MTIIPIMIFSIPLVAIIGGYYIKLQRMKMEHQQLNRTDSQLKTKVGQLLDENEEMKERLKTLEYLLLDEKTKSKPKINLENWEKEKIQSEDNSKWRY